MVICPVCGVQLRRITHKHCASHGLTIPQWHMVRLESESGYPIREFLQNVYVKQRLSSTEIFSQYSLTYRMLRTLLEECNIPMRERGDAVAASWEKDDGTRSQLISKNMQERMKRLDFSGDNNPAKRPGVRNKISRAKKKSNPGLLPMLEAQREYRLANPSTLEIAMMEALDNAGIAYERERRVRRYYIDFVLPSIKVGIECDGRGWHTLNPQHDARRDAWLAQQGWHIFRFDQLRIQDSADKCVEDLIADLNRLGFNPPTIPK